MPVTPGTRLGPYEILAPLGAGGMGEVYKASDTRLDRSVAIKVLAEHLSGDPIFRQRFEREAKAISSLNHPHICALFDVGQQDGIDFLVMEYLEGETLGARLQRGPPPIKEVLRIAVQIADALDKAHRQGVIHRDLKPGNVMLTKSGVKLLDFGLATVQAGGSGNSSLTSLPTASAPVTAHGTILGTFQYMSPEQLEGRQADVRSDVFAFGAVLYELVTGRRAFEGKTQGSLIAAILKDEPRPIPTLAPMTPPALDRLVRTCLEKDPDERRQSMHDVLLELKWIAEAGSQAGMPAPVVAHRKNHERLTQAAALVLALTTIALLIVLVRRPLQSTQPMRLTADIGANASLVTDGGPAAVLSPDAARLALLARGADGKTRIYVRALDQLDAAPLSGTEGAANPFFSPDSQWIGFFADRKLKKISVQGGAAVALCDAAVAEASWSEDDTIVFSGRGLSKVSSAGGTPERLTTLDEQAGEVSYSSPQILPGSQAVLFNTGTSLLNYQPEIAVYSFSTKQRKTVHRGGFFPRYLPTGHLVYVTGGTLFAAPFDLTRLEVTGPAAPVLEGVAASVTGVGESQFSAQFSFSDTGHLVYVNSDASEVRNRSIYWMDRAGTFTPIREAPGAYSTPRFSPDGKRLAMHISDGRRVDVWVYDLERDTLTRLTSAGDANRYPAWTPDGMRVAYHFQERGAPAGLFWTRADGTGDPQRLTQSEKQQIPNSWRPDGKVLAFHEVNPGTGADVMTVSVEGTETSGWKSGDPRPFLTSSSAEWRPAFSPDGRWLAYTSDESGKQEVYVQLFPGKGGKQQISSGGGVIPKWSRNGKDLFYRTPDNTIKVATYTATANAFHAEKPRLWSPGQFTGTASGDAGNFDLHPDGKRFAVLMPPNRVETASVHKVTVILNFFDELRRRTGK